LIPETPEDWDTNTLNQLVSLKDIEGENFDFKNKDIEGLYTHICAMANTSGGYLVLGVDEEKDEKTGYVFGFDKNGFDNDKRKYIETLINNAIINIDPYPKVRFANVEDDNKLYPIIKIEAINYQKPYFVKGSGACYIRAGKFTGPASRSTVFNLSSEHFQRRNSILRLRAACRDLISQIRYTSRDIKDANPRDVLSLIKPLNLVFLQNSVLDTEWLFLENDLHGEQIGEYSEIEGYLSWYNKLERLNLAIDKFNRSIDTFNQEIILQGRAEIKQNEMGFWYESGAYSKSAILFLHRIIDVCWKYESTTTS
jgi:hypothetical protein